LGPHIGIEKFIEKIFFGGTHILEFGFWILGPKWKAAPLVKAEDPALAWGAPGMHRTRFPNDFNDLNARRTSPAASRIAHLGSRISNGRAELSTLRWFAAGKSDRNSPIISMGLREG
jgi:hypothetical protein